MTIRDHHRGRVSAFHRSSATAAPGASAPAVGGVLGTTPAFSLPLCPLTVDSNIRTIGRTLTVRRQRAPRMTKTATIGSSESITCPKCSSSRVRDMRRLPVLMGIWFGCLAAIAALLLVRRAIPGAQVWLVLSSCLPAAMLAGWIFCRVARRRAAKFECKDCHNRWRDA